MTRRLPSALAVASVLAVAGGALAAQEPPPRTIEVVAHDFKFEPAVIEIAEGERVTLHVRATDGRKHGIAIKELKVKADLPKTGEVVSVDLVGGKPGTYVLSCSVYCGSGHSRMKGRLVVKARAR